PKPLKTLASIGVSKTRLKHDKKSQVTTHQQKQNKNNPKKQEKHPQKPKHGSVANKNRWAINT
ncbi:6-phosphogluconate dehydrogenase-like protein, partial [Gardnerella pickettii 00703Bmash]|uniref:hypothetical protein n=1 Tax=Gardnerella pickettii TaxID=2914924 RepID=UPI00026355C1